MNHDYHFSKLWEGKDPNAIVTERHDIVLLFDVTNCNPNGDPDTGNMPRIQPDTLKGLVTDVCLKRKVRNFFALNNSDGTPKGNQPQDEERYLLFIREGAVIQSQIEDSSINEKAKDIFLKYKIEEKNLTEDDWKNASKKSKKNNNETKNEEKQKKSKTKNLTEFRDLAFHDALCQKYFDIRYFGSVVSTEGPLKGSFYGQIRGPLQITFAESLDKILQLDFSITRCVVANEKEAEKKGDDNRTMGRKHTVPYGLYRSHIHFSPAFAAKTGFTYADLDNFLFALTRCLGDYNMDNSAARPSGMRVVGLVDFEHSSSLGNAPAHKLFDLVKVEGIKEKNSDGVLVFKSSGSEFPQSLQDYHGTAPDGDIYTVTNSYGSVTQCTTEKPAPKNGNQPVSNIKAHQIVWEIPNLS